MHIIESGNVAAALGVKLSKAQVVAAYPITPQTPLTEKLSELIESGQMNAQYIPVESEHSALAVCIAASTAGARAFTATSANGLLYMHEQIHWAAGARLPLVMCVVNRGVGAPWTIWNDHQDSMSQRDTGWIQMYACDHQQIIDSVIKAFRLAETAAIPVMVCYDGYLLSHTYMPVDVPDEQQVDAFLPPYQPERFLDPEKPANFNTVTLPEPRPDSAGHPAPGYMEFRARLHEDMRTALTTAQEIEQEFSKRFGRGGDPYVEAYRCEDASFVAVSLGSLAYQLRDVVDALREEGIRAGVAAIRLYRPFPDEAVSRLLSNAEKVIVFEKALSYGYEGPLCADIKSALYTRGHSLPGQPDVQGIILGLGGREIKTEDLIHEFRRSCAIGRGSEPYRWLGMKIQE